MQQDADRAERLWRRAEGVLAAGLWSLTRGTVHYPGGAFPLMAEQGEGCYLTDTSGRRYIDWIMGWGTSLLGYCHPEIERAIIDQLRATGPLLSLEQPIETEVARLVREAVPCAEAVAFGKNGSDVLGGAVRLARAATGREGIVICGFHGFHEWYMASQSWCEGIPEALRYLITQVPYNDLDGVRDLFVRHPDGIAAVVIDPVCDQLPQPGYFEGLREVTLDHDALLVFDEVVTGFRTARGGAQEAFGVTPDLACLGKTLANGMPLSALVGKREVMKTLPRVGYGMTFRGEALSLAAARRNLEILRDEPVLEHVHRIGSDLQERFDAKCRQLGLSGRMAGVPSRLRIQFDAANGVTPLGQLSLMTQECLKRGVLIAGLIYPCYAHGDAEVETTAAALDASLERVATALDQGSVREFLHAPAVSFYFDDDAIEVAQP